MFFVSRVQEPWKDPGNGASSGIGAPSGAAGTPAAVGAIANLTLLGGLVRRRAGWLVQNGT